jgi:B12-binding domain/radical SAM domain protein
VEVNGISNRPTTLDNVNFDYGHFLKMTIKYHDPDGYLPFRTWLANPVMAVFTCRGCCHNCASCGGSGSSFAALCRRREPAFRSPELLATDIRNIASFTGAPIMIIGDLLQGGEDYAERFYRAVTRFRVENELAIEFFHPPSARFVAKTAASLKNFNVEISPESHDPQVRQAFGKSYCNDELEESIEAIINSSCRRLDLFFMVGLPRQNYQSVMESVEYCGQLLEKFGKSGKLLPMIAPLAPFIDPGSKIFESPEEHGYRLFYRTLREHRQAMLKPTWKLRLNYETEWMSREEIVAATYDGALRLVQLKAVHGVMDREEAAQIQRHIRLARDLSRRLEEASQLDDTLMAEIHQVNRLDFLCTKHELDWPVKGWKINLLNIGRFLFGSRTR